jgi:sec-independent protein translocase protein TatB
MFDIGFSELLVIGVVALIVIGPERLPGVARTLGHLMGRMQRYVNEVKSDIQREMELDELKKLRESVEASAREIEQSVSREVSQAEEEMREIKALVEPAADSVEPAGSRTLPPAPVATAASAGAAGAPSADATPANGATTAPPRAPDSGDPAPAAVPAAVPDGPRQPT